MSVSSKRQEEEAKDSKMVNSKVEYIPTSYARRTPQTSQRRKWEPWESR